MPSGWHAEVALHPEAIDKALPLQLHAFLCNWGATAPSLGLGPPPLGSHRLALLVRSNIHAIGASSCRLTSPPAGMRARSATRGVASAGAAREAGCLNPGKPRAATTDCHTHDFS